MLFELCNCLISHLWPRILTFWGRLLYALICKIQILNLHPKCSIIGALNQSTCLFHSYHLYANKPIELLCKAYIGGHYLSRFHIQINLGALSFYLCFGEWRICRTLSQAEAAETDHIFPTSLQFSTLSLLLYF